MGHALIVEDDADAARMVAQLVASHGFSAATAQSLGEARRQMALQQPDVVLLDLKLPDGDGMALLDDTDLLGNSDVVLMTGHASLETSIRALRAGAVDYLVKPVNPHQLQGILARVRRTAPTGGDALQEVREQAHRSGRFGHLVGRSAPMLQVYEQVARVAGTSFAVFITGESGTGKELVARSVHDMGPRRGKPFLAVNCGAISPNLIESEIFGHEKGSFTGAERQHHGFFERAHGGTLFLDEITEMPLALQVKLLRVLESGTVMRVGSTTPIATDVRIVTASNRDPLEAVAQGRFREDLLYRLNVFPIELPPLRERKDDLPLLARHFLAEIHRREGVRRTLTPAALSQLAQHAWPGNVRELRNALQRAWVMSDGSEITERWLPRAAVPASATGSVLLPIGVPLADVERRVIAATLEHFQQDVARAAAALGISPRTLAAKRKA